MPCDSGPSYCDHSDFKRKIKRLTRSLCYLTGGLAHDGLLEEYANPDIVEWFNEHSEEDRKRISLDLKERYGKDSSFLDRPSDLADSYLEEERKHHPTHRGYRDLVHGISSQVSMSIIGDLEKKAAQEKTRQDALEKLTSEERVALGLGR